MRIISAHSRNVLSEHTAAGGCECIIVVLIGCIEVNKQYMARSLERVSKCATSDRKSETPRSMPACPHSPAPCVFVVEHENTTLTTAPRRQKKRADDWRAGQQAKQLQCLHLQIECIGEMWLRCENGRRREPGALQPVFGPCSRRPTFSIAAGRSDLQLLSRHNAERGDRRPDSPQPCRYAPAGTRYAAPPRGDITGLAVCVRQWRANSASSGADTTRNRQSHLLHTAQSRTSPPAWGAHGHLGGRRAARSQTARMPDPRDDRW